jgi:hypothetical protein
MLRRTMILGVLLSALLVPTPAPAAEGGDAPAATPTKAHGLLQAAANMDKAVARLTAKADALEAKAATLETEAAATTPPDSKKLREAARAKRQAAKFDAMAAKFTTKAAAFRAKAAARLAKVDDDPAAKPEADRAEGLLKAAKLQRAHAAKKTASAERLRTEANATTPPDAAKLADAA